MVNHSLRCGGVYQMSYSTNVYIGHQLGLCITNDKCLAFSLAMDKFTNARSSSMLCAHVASAGCVCRLQCWDDWESCDVFSTRTHTFSPSLFHGGFNVLTGRNRFDGVILAYVTKPWPRRPLTRKTCARTTGASFASSCRRRPMLLHTEYLIYRFVVRYSIPRSTCLILYKEYVVFDLYVTRITFISL